MSETRDKMRRVVTPADGRICDICNKPCDIIYDMPVSYPRRGWANICEICRLENMQIYVSFGYIRIADHIDPKTLSRKKVNTKPDDEYVPTEEDLTEYEKEVELDDESLGIISDDDESDITKATHTNPHIPFDR